jgi:hypothetical protein
VGAHLAVTGVSDVRASMCEHSILFLNEISSHLPPPDCVPARTLSAHQPQQAHHGAFLDGVVGIDPVGHHEELAVEVALDRHLRVMARATGSTQSSCRVTQTRFS